MTSLTGFALEVTQGIVAEEWGNLASSARTEGHRNIHVHVVYQDLTNRGNRRSHVILTPGTRGQARESEAGHASPVSAGRRQGILGHRRQGLYRTCRLDLHCDRHFQVPTAGLERLFGGSRRRTCMSEEHVSRCRATSDRLTGEGAELINSRTLLRRESEEVCLCIRVQHSDGDQSTVAATGGGGRG